MCGVVKPMIEPILYACILYLCFLPSTRLVGVVLLAAHLGKARWSPLSAWPAWMEPVALAIASFLLVGDDAAARWIGLAMLVGHCRQLLFGDDVYYGWAKK